MSQAVFLVLALASPPGEEQRAALSAYEHTRLVRFVEPRAAAAPARAYPAYGAELAAELEAELEAARTAAASLDEKRALELLEGFEQKLTLHPELPQSAWLMAERLRLQAELGASSQRATDDLRRALALDGKRAAEFGQKLAEPALPERRAVRVEGLDPRDELAIDGRAIAGRTPELAAGLHHVRVVRGQRLLFAGWLALGEGASALVLRVPAIVPCSADDVAGFRVEGERAVAAPGTRCARWVLAAPARGGLRFADCFADRCGPFVTYRGGARAASLPPQPEREKPSRLLVQATAIGAALVAGGAILLWRSGTFDEQKPAETRWVYGGVTPAE